MARGQGEAGCSVSDPGDYSYSEWISRGRHRAYGPGYEVPPDIWTRRWHEDDEDGDQDTGVEDGSAGDDGAPSDPEDAESSHDAEETYEDLEREQMIGDVPAPHVFALEPNIFTGERERLGVNASGAFIGDVKLLDGHRVTAADVIRVQGDEAQHPQLAALEQRHHERPPHDCGD